MPRLAPGAIETIALQQSARCKRGRWPSERLRGRRSACLRLAPDAIETIALQQSAASETMAVGTVARET